MFLEPNILVLEVISISCLLKKDFPFKLLQQKERDQEITIRLA